MQIIFAFLYLFFSYMYIISLLLYFFTSSSGNHNNREGTYYQLLSERSKKRLDQLRQCVAERLLLNYTLVSVVVV